MNDNKILICIMVILILPVIIFFMIDHNHSKQKAEEYYSIHKRWAVVNGFYSYEDGTDEILICDPDKIAGIALWDEGGCAAVYGSRNIIIDNETIYECIHNENNTDQYDQSVMDVLYSVLCYKQRTDEWRRFEYDVRIIFLEAGSNYTMEEIDDALEIFVYGGNNVSKDNRYKSVADVPYDLANACVAAINSVNISGETTLTEAWDKVVDDGVTINE